MSSYQAQVLYEYVAQDDDQLTIKPGEIVTVIDAAQELNGWALAQKGDREGYVPAEYVRSIDDSASTHQPYVSSDYNLVSDEWQPSGFKTFYETVLSQEHQLPFCFKLTKATKEVLVPCPCSRFDYVMARGDSRRGALLTLLFGVVICSFDAFSIIAPALPFGDESVSGGQLAIVFLNLAVRMALTLFLISRYPRQNLNLTTMPMLNVVSAFTFSIRIYEALELGDNKEYDGFRYYRSWMWASAANLPFEVAALIMVIVDTSAGSVALSVLVLVGNLLNVGRCFLASWARKESGNDIHPDFEQTIKRYKL